MAKRASNGVTAPRRRPLVALAVAAALSPSAVFAGSLLSNGTVALGVNDQGNLIYHGVGLRYIPTGGEALAPGCYCEGWGVADLYTRKYAKAGEAFGDANLVLESFTQTTDGAISVVQAAGVMRVTHAVAPSLSNNLYQMTVTVENLTDNPIHLRYRRTMDWDVPPTTFSEMVTIAVNGARDVIYTNDNGFGDGNPLVNVGKIRFEGEAVDNGPADHGALFDFDFGDLASHKSKEFVIYYGAAKNEFEALNALSMVGAEVYSLGKPNPSHSQVQPDGTPNTYIFGFGGVGGRPIVPVLPDLTLGGLRIIDNGAGQPIGLTARVGNAGHPDSGTVEGVVVNFYAGDPTSSGTLLGSRTLSSLAPGSFTEVALPAVSPTPTQQIYAWVDPLDEVRECRESNNRHDTPVASSTAQGDISVGTDQPAYGPDSAVQLTGSVTNTGAFAYELRAQLFIEDAAGNGIHAFPEQALGSVASNTSVALTADWNSGRYLTGSYRLRGVLRDVDGVQIDEAVAPFEIRADLAGGPAAAIQVLVDKPTYHPFDIVNLDTALRNTTLNQLLSNTTFQLTITAPDSSVVFAEIRAIDSLTSSQLLKVLSQLTLNGAALGAYQVTASLLAADGNVIASDTTSFSVANDLSRAITGAVQADKPQLYRGETQICRYTVNNDGTVTLVDLPVYRSLLDMSEGTLVRRESDTITLEPGQTSLTVRSESTADLTPGVHACALHATIDGQEVALGFDQFTVEQPPIIIQSSLDVGSHGRLLILLDADESGVTPEPHGPSGAASLAAQRDHLETLLTTAGWSYTIVTSADDFALELRSGGYAGYLLFNEQVKLPNTVQKELREAVFRGEGLVVAGDHDQRNALLDDALGINFRGTQQVGSVSGEAVGTLPLTVTGSGAVIESAGAEVLARYDSGGPAITRHAFGTGAALYVGFDWLAEATSNPISALDMLLDYSVSEVHPAELPVVAGGVTPVTIQLENEGIATSVEVTLELPTGVTVVDAPEAVSTAGTLTWILDLAEGEQRLLESWLRLPEGEITLTAHLRTGSEGTWVTYGEPIELHWWVAATAGIDDALTIAAASASDKAVQQAIQWLDKAEGRVAKGDLEGAIFALVEASDTLDPLLHSELRAAIAAALRSLELNWWALTSST